MNSSMWCDRAAAVIALRTHGSGMLEEHVGCTSPS